MKNIFHTYKNKILDIDNHTIIIKGVSKTGFEYGIVDLNTMIPETIQFDINKIIEWGFNAVRIPLRDIFWLDNQLYRDKIYYWINKLLENDIIIILDLHTQQNNPGLDNFMLKNDGHDGKKMWIDIAERFKNNSFIFFEIFNEPHNIDENIWWNGSDKYYGYKEILQDIRQKANNICIIGGVDWAFQWAFIKKYPHIIKDLTNFKNIVLATHPYGYRGGPNEDNISTLQIPTNLYYPDNYQGDCHLGITFPNISFDKYGWDDSFGFIMKDELFPLIATEWGLDRPDNCIQGGWYNVDILKYINSLNMSYVAWAWVQDRLDYPSLLDEDFNPTGRSTRETYGPACSGILNNYYSGPGNLVYNDLKKFNKHKRIMFCNYQNNNTNNNVDNNLSFLYIIFCLLLISFIFIFFKINKRIYKKYITIELPFFDDDDENITPNYLNKKIEPINIPIIEDENKSPVCLSKSVRIRSSHSLCQIK